MKPLYLLGLTVAGVVGIILFNAAFIVRESEQMMVLAFGRVERVITEPGLHFKVPFVQQLSLFDKRIIASSANPEEVQSRDKKRVVIDSFTRWRITDAKRFFETVRTVDQARVRLNTIVNSAIRGVVARMDLSDLISDKRAGVMYEITQLARREATELGVEVVDVRIMRADLPESNSRAVFNRMKAEREKEAKEIRAEGAEAAQKIRADAERQRTILIAEATRDAQKLKGEGDAAAIRIGAAAFGRDPQFYGFIRALDAYRTSLVGGDTLMVLDPQTEFLKTFEGR